MVEIKRILRVLLLLCVAFLVACENDDEPSIIPDPAEEEEILITDQSGVTIVNTKDVVVGEGDTDEVFLMISDVLGVGGVMPKPTLNCCGMAAIAIDHEAGEVDSDRKVENVTLINRGTITIHTKDLVERYKDQIVTPDNPDRPYTYLRVLAMYAGANSTVINEGVINVYFDHDPSVTATVYVMGLIAGEGSSLINNGEIHFYGTGSVATRLRGMATFGDNVSAFNKGIMTAELDMAEDARMITTGGDGSNVFNDGIMQMRMPGKLLCMTRYGDSNLINNNLIDLTLVDMPQGYTSILGDEDHIVCGLYEPLQTTRSGMPPLINRGTINITIEGTERSEPQSQGYGMFCDLMEADAENLEANIVNYGDIHVYQSGPIRFNMAEAGFSVRQRAAAGTCHIKLGYWNTTLRDFAQTQDLFLGKGASLDFGGGELCLSRTDDYVDGTPYSVAPEALFHNAGDDGLCYEYSGYEGLDISVASSDTVSELDWDRENRTVALHSK